MPSNSHETADTKIKAVSHEKDRAVNRVVVSVAFGEDEHRLVADRAARAGLKISTYIRNAALTKPEFQTTIVPAMVGSLTTQPSAVFFLGVTSLGDGTTRAPKNLAVSSI